MTESGLNPECLIVIFIRDSQGAIEVFCSLGYAIYILDVNIKTDYLEFCNGQRRWPMTCRKCQNSMHWF
jgi:hypothetical protein